MRVSVVSYNVAGLPELLSASRPSVNNALISPRLNQFDIVLVQEDFWYHDDLSSEVGHTYSSRPSRKGLFGLGDGLNRFASHEFGNHCRFTWERSHGIARHRNDRLARKGFSAATHLLSEALAVDVYNLHMDAGTHWRDYLAREAQISQLARVIDEESRDAALIVGGDFNLRGDRPEEKHLLRRFMKSLSLRDPRDVLGAGEERIDRILFRGSGEVEIEPVGYRVELDLFRDGLGNPLSDHDAVSADLVLRPGSSQYGLA